MATVGEQRWERRRWSARAVRTVAFLAPALLSLGVASLVSRLLPEPVGPVASVAWWAALLVGSGVALVGFDRLFRRLLPLSVLLNLALVFPGAAPSRFSAAIRGGSVRNLEERIEQAKVDAASADVVEAASTVVELVGALAAHDPRTRGHCERTRAFADLIAEELGLGEADRDRLRWSALLHDIGKLHVEPSLLNKPSRPDESEWLMLQSHPVEGARVVGALAAWLGPWALAIEQHHERFDGGGYPKGLSGHDISLAGRIVAVADAYEVMTAVRAYKRPMSAAAAREELVRSAGTHFDPHIVRAFLRVSISRLPRAAALTLPLAQLPGVVGLQRMSERSGAVLASGAGVAALVAAGVVGPVGGGGLGGGGRGGDGPDVGRAGAGAEVAVAATAPSVPSADPIAPAADGMEVRGSSDPAPLRSPAASSPPDAPNGADGGPDGSHDPGPAPASDPTPPDAAPSPRPEPEPHPAPQPEPEPTPRPEPDAPPVVSGGIEVRTEPPLPAVEVGIRVTVEP